MPPRYHHVKVDTCPSGWHWGPRDSHAFKMRVKWGQAGWGLAGRIHRDLVVEEAESANAGLRRIEGRLREAPGRGGLAGDNVAVTAAGGPPAPPERTSAA